MPCACIVSWCATRNSGVVRHCWDGAFGAAHRHLRSSQPCGGDRRVLSSLQKKEVYATAIWHDGLAFGDGTGRYHVQQTEAGDVADQRAVARACVVENSHLPNGGLGLRGTVGNEGVAESDVAHAQIVGAGLPLNLLCRPA